MSTAQRVAVIVGGVLFLIGVVYAVVPVSGETVVANSGAVPLSVGCGSIFEEPNLRATIRGSDRSTNCVAAVEDRRITAGVFAGAGIVIAAGTWFLFGQSSPRREE
jgi:hypothetical protein